VGSVYAHAQTERWDHDAIQLNRIMIWPPLFESPTKSKKEGRPQGRPSFVFLAGREIIKLADAGGGTHSRSLPVEWQAASSAAAEEYPGQFLHCSY
jgi:hypothetical protein